jgi:hypothetical protein
MLRPLVKLPLDDVACGRLWAAFCAVQGVARSLRHTDSVHTSSLLGLSLSLVSLFTRVRGIGRGSMTQPQLLSERTRPARGSQRLCSLDPDTALRYPLCDGRGRDPAHTVRAARVTHASPSYRPSALTIAPAGTTPAVT